MHAFRSSRARKHGQIAKVMPFAGYGSTTWVRVLARVVFSRPPGLARRTPRVDRGWRSFTNIAVDYAEVWITIAGERHRVLADRGGVVDIVLQGVLEPGWQVVSIQAEDSEPVEAPIFVVDPSVTFGVISDIDDTIMVTALPKPFVAFWNTFVIDEFARTAVPGMSVLFERLASHYPGCPVIYLSTGPWNAAPTLARFLSRHLFPPGPLLLTDWGPTHDRFFRSGTEHKQRNLSRVAQDFPNIQWLLVGDDGQHDEARYRELVAAFPSRVRAVAIRQLSAGEAVLAGGRERTDAAEQLDEVDWLFAPDGAGLAQLLERKSIL